MLARWTPPTDPTLATGRGPLLMLGKAKQAEVAQLFNWLKAKKLPQATAQSEQQAPPTLPHIVF